MSGFGLPSLSLSGLVNAASELKAQYYPKNETERRIYEALSNKNWGASSTLLIEIASDSMDYDKYRIIGNLLWPGLDPNSRGWRQIFKALTLIEYLVKNGSEKFIEDCRDNMHKIRPLQDYNYYEESVDKGSGTREMAKKIVELLSSNENIREEREKARQLRQKLGGSLSRNTASSDYSGGGGGGYSGGGGGDNFGRRSQYDNESSSFGNRDNYDSGPRPGGKYANDSVGSDSHGGRDSFGGRGGSGGYSDGGIDSGKSSFGVNGYGNSRRDSYRDDNDKGRDSHGGANDDYKSSLKSSYGGGSYSSDAPARFSDDAPEPAKFDSYSSSLGSKTKPASSGGGGKFKVNIKGVGDNSKSSPAAAPAPAAEIDFFADDNLPANAPTPAVPAQALDFDPFGSAPINDFGDFTSAPQQQQMNHQQQMFQQQQ